MFVPSIAIHTEPSGAARMPYGIDLGVCDSNTFTLPVRGSSTPYVLLFASVNQILPPCTMGVCGFFALGGSGNSVIWRVFGSRRPIRPVSCAVYHTMPSGPASMPCGPEPGVGVGVSVISPVAGSSRPMKLFVWSVYHTMPSGPTAGSCGKLRSRGIAYSTIAAFAVPGRSAPVRRSLASTETNRLANRTSGVADR